MVGDAVGATVVGIGVGTELVVAVAAAMLVVVLSTRTGLFMCVHYLVVGASEIVGRGVGVAPVVIVTSSIAISPVYDEPLTE